MGHIWEMSYIVKMLEFIYFVELPARVDSSDAA